jgi:hypothetical protein
MAITTRAGRHERFAPYADRELAAAGKAASFLRATLDLPSEDRHYWDPGYTRGQLDESSLWQIASGITSPRCFQQPETVQLPAIFLSLLVDCSGSMAGTEMSRARSLALAFARALDGHPKCKVSVAGHTERGGDVQLFIVKSPTGPLVERAFGSLNAQSGNLDAYALQAYAKHIASQMGDHDTGMIALICDGEPCHSPQAMREAMEQVRRDHKLHTLGIGVGSCMSTRQCDELYGENNYVIAEDPLDTLPMLATKVNRFIARLAPV